MLSDLRICVRNVGAWGIAAARTLHAGHGVAASERRNTMTRTFTPIQPDPGDAPAARLGSARLHALEAVAR